MLLRASGETQGRTFDLNAVTDDSAKSGVPHGAVLTAFADAAVRGSASEVAKARDAVADEMGQAAVVDAAGIIANFERMVRIADGTGIPLDRPVAVFSTDIRDELGIDAYGHAANTPPVGPAMRVLGRVGRPLLGLFMRLYARSS